MSATSGLIHARYFHQVADTLAAASPEEPKE